MKFRLLGQLEARDDRGEIDLGSPKQRSVLAILLLHANDVVSTDRIIDEVWGDQPPRTAEHSVQIYISELRKALANGTGTELIDTHPPGYVINVPPDTVDTLRFETLVRGGIAALHEGDHSSARHDLEQALELWEGEPLADFIYEDFAQGYIRSLTELRSDALEALAALDLEQGDYSGARNHARAAIEADPLREEPRRVMMLALYRSGRQAEALRHFGAYQQLLSDELGIEPSDSLRQLEERILLQDPDLDATPRQIAEGNPYRGLRAFSESDADVYYGREALVAEVLEGLESGPGFVSIVGPSGSGKSSAVKAGVAAQLRKRGETVLVFQPGSRPLWELAGAMDRAGLGSRAALLRRFETDTNSLRELVERPMILIVDQFEELFTLAEPDVCDRFAGLIASAVKGEGTPLKVVATLRADYYDRPLSLPALADVFTDSVVSVKPMTPEEVERAVVEPARVAGVEVEPALLAQLIADMSDEPGALPLLQFTLFELFEQSDRSLSLSAYRRLGGLNGALTEGADRVVARLDRDGRALAEQLMMRMIQRGRTHDTARPVSVRDLADLGFDTVELQSVLEAFGSSRLITFDRDSSGSAIVEMAHEYLISEWPQMGEWLEEHIEDLELLSSLQSAAAEWISADRSADYLLRGERLERFERWRNSTTLRLTGPEARYLDASIDLRSREQAASRDRAEQEEGLRRKARRRLWAFGASLVALSAALTTLIVLLIPDPPPDVILWSESREGGFGRQIGEGFDAALADLNLTGAEFLDNEIFADEVEDLIERGTPLVMMTLLNLSEDVMQALIGRHPETQFVLIDCSPELDAQIVNLEHVSCIVATHEEMGFLAGVAAGHLTSTDHVGIVVGVNNPYMQRFETGFRDGVNLVDPGVEATSVYLTEADFSGFVSPTLGFMAANEMSASGADVIFSAAGEAYWGVVESAYGSAQPCCVQTQYGRVPVAVGGDNSVWTVAVDEDWYLRVEGDPRLDPFIATSVVKRLEVGVYEAIEQFSQTGQVETVALDLGNGGIDYVTSGGHIDEYVPALDAAKRAVIDGSIQLSADLPEDVTYLGDLVQP